MIFTKIKKAILVSGYSRAAIQFQQLTDEQLASAGLSRRLLKLGHKAYPWREGVKAQGIPDNVSSLNAAKSVNPTSIMPQAPKAA